MNLSFAAVALLANYLLIFSLVIFAFLRLGKMGKDITEKPESISSKLIFASWGAILVLALLAFRSIFSPGPAAWGDVPYYHPDAFKEFFLEPLVWEARGRLGIVNDLYWIYPLMFVYKALGAFLNLGNDIIIRLIFYFPAILLAFLSPWLLTRYLNFSPIVSLFASLVYGLNTYFILVIDGGQVGVALAYGLFPFALLGLIRLTTIKTTSQFFTSLMLFMLLIIADVRFAIMALATFVLLRGIAKANLKTLTLFGLAALGLSAYWLIPAFTIQPTTGSGMSSGLPLVSVLNPLFLYSPHWPLNEFGKILPIPWYFIGVPLLIIWGLVIQRSKVAVGLFFCFLTFAFLAKGETGLLGNFYSIPVATIPLAGAFRDSTKFFAPLMLFAGILIGLTVQSFQRYKFVFPLVFILVFSYLAFLVHPALLGNMHGVLAKRDYSESIKIIGDNVTSQNGFLRTAWFPERPAEAYHTENKPALDAKSLVNYRPFATLNTGTLDTFNFLHQESSLDWLRLIGAKFLVFPGDSRKFELNQEEQEDWGKLLALVESKKELSQVSWNTDFPVYELNNTTPRIFGVEKAVIVVGSDDIYKKLESENEKFSVSNQGFLFVEDGKTDVDYLTKVASGSAILVFNDAESVDLAFSFLKKYFADTPLCNTNQWAVRTSAEYLKWKYELLTKGVETYEFDYGKGIAFSAVGGEKIIYNLKVPQRGKYVLGVRALTHGGSLKVGFGDVQKDVKTKNMGNLEWDITENLDLEEGDFTVTLENRAELSVLNTITLIPQDEWEKSQNSAETLISKMESFDISQMASYEVGAEIDVLSKVLELNSWHEIPTKFVSPVEYTLSVGNSTNWVVFTDAYNKDWKIKDREDLASLPFYSMVNGFYLPDEGQYKMVFAGQDKVLPGLYISLLSLGLILAIYFKLVLFPRLHRKNEKLN